MLACLPGVIRELNEAPYVVTGCYCNPRYQGLGVQLGIILHSHQLHHKTVLLLWQLEGMEETGHTQDLKQRCVITFLQISFLLHKLKSYFYRALFIKQSTIK